jgi:hypothetical protein
MREFNCPFTESVWHSTQQENMVNTAKEMELVERPVIRSSHMFYEKRNSNVVIKSSQNVQALVLLKKLPQLKLE